MEQPVSVTGSRHNRSTAASRNRARTRATRLGQFERNAHKAADAAKLRISTSKVTPWILATGLMLAGSIEPR
jgi:hypothetical protein